MSSSTLAPETNTSANCLADKLSDVMGCRFCLFKVRDDASDCCTNPWQPANGALGDETLLGILPNKTIHEPSFLYDRDRIDQSVDERLGRLAIPISSSGQRLLAVSRDPAETSEDKLRLARLVTENLRLEERIEEQDAEADQFAVQISRDFEELMFLQRMMESLDVASADAELADVTTAILKQLQPAIEAKTLLFLSSRERDGRSAINVRQEFICVGEAIDVDWSELLDVKQHDYSDGPLVRNRIDDVRHPKVEQFVSAEIRNRTQRFGWLIAVNRAPGLICSLDGTQSEAEFGTYEASLLSSAASVMATYALNRELLHRKERLLIDVVRCLVSAIDAKDDYTRGHSIRVALFARCLADELGWSADRSEEMYMAGLLHDVGKIGVPDEILKKPGPLNDEEKALIRKHPDHGWTILHQLEELHHVLPGVVHHHEAFDGNGYPDKLADESIPIEGRVLAVADAYDAIVSDRAYRKGRSHSEALEILKQGSGAQWDPEVVEAFESVSEKIEQLAKDYRHTPPPVRKT